MIAYLLHLARRVSLKGYLISWGLFGLVITHSSFVEPSFFLHNPRLPRIANHLYFYGAAIGLALFLAKHWPSFSLRLDRYTVLAFVYMLCAPLSILINQTQSVAFNVDFILIPGIIGIALTRLFGIRDVHAILRMMVVYGLVNILLSFLIGAQRQGAVGSIFSCSGLITDRNGFVRYLSIVNAYCFVELVGRLKRHGRMGNTEKGLLAAMALILATVILQLSRSGYIVYILSVSALGWWSQSKRIRRVTFLVIPVLLVVFSYFVYLRVTSEGMTDLNYSDILRIALLKAGWNMVRHSPWFGLGYHMSIHRYLEFADRNYIADPAIDDIHNWFLSVWAEQGIFAVIVFAWLNLGLMYHLFRYMRNRPFTEAKLPLFCFVALLVLMVDAMVLPNYDYESTYWIVIAASIVVYKLNKPQRDPSPRQAADATGLHLRE